MKGNGKTGSAMGQARRKILKDTYMKESGAMERSQGTERFSTKISLNSKECF